MWESGGDDIHSVLEKYTWCSPLIKCISSPMTEIDQTQNPTILRGAKWRIHKFHWKYKNSFDRGFEKWGGDIGIFMKKVEIDLMPNGILLDWGMCNHSTTYSRE